MKIKALLRVQCSSKHGEMTHPTPCSQWMDKQWEPLVADILRRVFILYLLFSPVIQQSVNHCRELLTDHCSQLPFQKDVGSTITAAGGCEGAGGLGGGDESPDLKPVQHKYDIQSVKHCSQGNTTKYKQKSKESFGRLGFVWFFFFGGGRWKRNIFKDTTCYRFGFNSSPVSITATLLVSVWMLAVSCGLKGEGEEHLLRR